MNWFKKLRKVPAPPSKNDGNEPCQLFEEARQRFDACQFMDALKLTEKAIALQRDLPGLFFLQGLCYDAVARHEEALKCFAAELAHNPGHAQARECHDRFAKALGKGVRAVIPNDQRSWKSSLPHETLKTLQQSLHNYHYRGVPMLKNPFDMALYPMLLWNLRPRTIIEIGSKSGGSGLWFGDLLNNFAIDGHVYSIDLFRVENVSHPRVTFLEGNGRELEKTLTPEFLRKLPRPWLVIEDADHAYDTTVRVLRFFHPLLEENEYIVVEDGITSDLEQDESCNSGPHRGLKEFLRENPFDYQIDGDYCDYFGYNVTWCTNGFLKKIRSGNGSADPVQLMSELEMKIESGAISHPFLILGRLKAKRVPTQNVDYLRAKCFLKENKMAAVEALKEELRYFPENKKALALLEELAPKTTLHISNDPEFIEILKIIQPYTMVGPARLLSLFNLAKYVCEQDIPGNFVECGVAAGGTSALLATVISRYSKRPRTLFCFDSFEGLPASSAVDTHRGKQAESCGWGAGTCAAPESSLLEVCKKAGVEQLIQPVKGFFSDTLPANRERVGPIAFLHMDGDWYASTQDILTNLYDQVMPGGRIQIDDYGYWEGCRKAVTDFAKSRNLEFTFNTIDESGVWISC